MYCLPNSFKLISYFQESDVHENTNTQEFVHIAGRQ